MGKHKKDTYEFDDEFIAQVVYTYQTADGSEEVIKGTGAMIYID